MVLEQVRTEALADIVVSVSAATDTGGRPDNEDAVLEVSLASAGDGEIGSQPGFLLAVADGMGGHQRGEVASQLAIETLGRMVNEDPGADTALLLKQAFRRANDVIHQNGRASGDGSIIGTTLVAVVIRGKYATIANIGDSRAYLVRANQLTQITRDHSLVAEQVAEGAMTSDEARQSPHRNILTHALGHRQKLDPKLPSIFEIVLLAEDRLILCSDGFHDVVGDSDMVEVVLQFDPPGAVGALIDLAKTRGTTDNVTAAVVRVESAKTVAGRERELDTVLAGRPSQWIILVVTGIILFVAIVIVALMVF
ncbi:MAG: protein phosphatase 2C domain-containing protein [Chloroflexota bacterium]|nr:protein phosphatase 2C domain-containing protein [Chloroflexota bacterium]